MWGRCSFSVVSHPANLKPNKVMHLTVIPLRSIAAGELGRSGEFRHGG